MDNITELVKKQYNQFPYPHIPVGSMEDEVLYSSNYEFVHYLCKGFFRQHKGIKILDAGCGTGYSTLKLAQQNPDAEIFALDLSKNSLDMAKSRIEKAGLLSGRITFFEGDLLKIEDLGQKFDYIVSTGVLHHLSSPETGLNFLKSQLKDDGLMYLMLYSEYGRYWLNLTRKFISILQEDRNNFSEGIEIGKEFLKVLKPENPILSTYLKSMDASVKTLGEEFANSEAQFVDAYVNAHERTYNISQLFDFIESNGLFFIRFLDEITWDIKTLFKGNPLLTNKAEKLSAKERYMLGEIINSENNFAFFISKKKTEKKILSDEEILKGKIQFSPLNKIEEIKDINHNTVLNILSPAGTGIQIGSEALPVFNLLENNKRVSDVVTEIQNKFNFSDNTAKILAVQFLKSLEDSSLIYFIDNG